MIIDCTVKKISEYKAQKEKELCEKKKSQLDVMIKDLQAFLNNCLYV